MIYKQITSHHGSPLNDKLVIEAIDAPNNAGAHCRYSISGFNTETNPSAVDFPGQSMFLHVLFQNGNPNDPLVGANGVTHEAFLAVLIDRLEDFQKGPFAHRRNNAALLHMKAALVELQLRTEERIMQGIEGQRIP